MGTVPTKLPLQNMMEVDVIDDRFDFDNTGESATNIHNALISNAYEIDFQRFC